MTNSSSSSHIKSFATNIPSFFAGTNYSYWKTKMTSFLQSTNLDLWDVIEDDPTFPSKLVYGVMVPKPKQKWDEHDKRNFQLNAKVVYILQCAMDRNKYKILISNFKKYFLKKLTF